MFIKDLSGLFQNFRQICISATIYNSMDHLLFFSAFFVILTASVFGDRKGGLPRVGDLFPSSVQQHHEPRHPPSQGSHPPLEASAAQQREMSSSQKVNPGQYKDKIINMLLERTGQQRQ